MKQVLTLYKPVGISPLQCIYQFRQQHPEYQKVKLGYAGRLDPMADGLLLVLSGEENRNRKQYEALPKEYECKILFGIETDTYDILGKITNGSNTIHRVSYETLQNILLTYIGKHKQPYPPYSSQPVNGKPLYYWAREGKLDGLAIPAKDIEIYAIALVKTARITGKELQKQINEKIANVTGNFRQKEILEIWNSFFENYPDITFPIAYLRISCSSGTYIRSFAHNLGKQLQTNAIALSITRTKVGEYTLIKQLLHWNF